MYKFRDHAVQAAMEMIEEEFTQWLTYGIAVGLYGNDAGGKRTIHLAGPEDGASLSITFDRKDIERVGPVLMAEEEGEGRGITIGWHERPSPGNCYKVKCWVNGKKVFEGGAFYGGNGEGDWTLDGGGPLCPDVYDLVVYRRDNPV